MLPGRSGSGRICAYEDEQVIVFSTGRGMRLAVSGSGLETSGDRAGSRSGLYGSGFGQVLSGRSGPDDAGAFDQGFYPGGCQF